MAPVTAAQLAPLCKGLANFAASYSPEASAATDGGKGVDAAHLAPLFAEASEILAGVDAVAEAAGAAAIRSQLDAARDIGQQLTASKVQIYNTLLPSYAAAIQQDLAAALALCPATTTPSTSRTTAARTPTPTASAVPLAVSSVVPEAASAGACPAGNSVSTLTSGGYSYRLIEADAYDFWLCVTTPSGTTAHLAESATGSSPFSGNTYFETDDLGHVFVNYPPGNVDGVAVVIPAIPPKFIEVTGARVVTASPSFKLAITKDNCIPNCAEGTSTESTAIWDAGRGTYVVP